MLRKYFAFLTYTLIFQETNMLYIISSRLEGNTHQVITGISIFYNTKNGYKENSFTELTKVKMAHLSNQVIDCYVQTGEPL